MHEENLIDIYDITYIPFWETSLFFYVSIITIFLLLLILLFFVVRYFYARKNSDFPIQKIIHELTVLKSLLLSHGMNSDEFYVQLLMNIKQYFQDQLHVSATSSTELQLAKAISLMPGFSDADQRFFCQLFERAQLIKFAKVSEINSIMLSDVDRCIKIVYQQDSLQKKLSYD